MSQPLLHYKTLAKFKSVYYKDLLSQEHVVGGQIRIGKIVLPDGSQDESFNFWGWKLEKNGTKYLLPGKDPHGKEILLREIMPILAKHTQKVAYRGEVLNVIMSYSSARFKSEKTMTFKELVHTLCAFKHTNPEHQKLLWMMGLSQWFGRANYRIATPAGFGKDSVVGTLGHLVGNCATIVNPTRAKLEYRTTYKLLAINEVASIAAAEWNLIEQFLLDAGDFKPSIEKQTRAGDEKRETMDISQFSLSLLYNDIDLVVDKEKYLDNKAHKALLNRFPPFRLYGVLSDDFSSIETINLTDFVTDHIDDFKKIIYSLQYYKENADNLQHKWNRNKLMNLESERWKTNLAVLLRTVDLYCDTQQEFDKWIEIINSSIQDYSEMLEYPELIEKFNKTQIKKTRMEAIEKIKVENTFKAKNSLLRNSENKNYSDGKVLW